MKLIFIFGPTASGKLTTARELSKLTGIPVFHNHLIVDAVCAVFPFGSDSFVRLRHEMWLSVFRAAAAENRSLIFTFAPESTVPHSFISETVASVSSLGGEVIFVELRCSLETIETRIENASRAEFQKLRSLATFRELRAKAFNSFPKIDADLVIDTDTSDAATSARTIAAHLNLVQ